MRSKRLDNAALAADINPNYINVHSKPQSISAGTRRRLLNAMHQRTTTGVAVMPALSVMVYTSGKKMPMVAEGGGGYSQLLTTEEGTQYKDHVAGGKAFNLPARPPRGYHTLTLTQDGRRAHCRVIVAPKRCYESQASLNKQELWGAYIQLYALRSKKNWGIRDFGDLKTMFEDMAKRGGSFIGLNPVYALYLTNPKSVSPYNLPSRRWLNVIYIGVNTVEDFHLSEEAQVWWQLPATRQTL